MKQRQRHRHIEQEQGDEQQPEGAAQKADLGGLLSADIIAGLRKLAVGQNWLDGFYLFAFGHDLLRHGTARKRIEILQ